MLETIYGFSGTGAKDALPLLFTPREAARLCAVCEKTLYLAVRRGELRVVKIGRATRYDPADLSAWIARLKSEGAGHE